MMESRPDPDQLLRQIKAEEREASTAKLKIFFGPYPGVGKTYSMLEAARERKREGQDVVIGIVETHGRPETAALIKDMEVLPRMQIPYKGITLGELDLDSALARKPQVIVVDELAHTNPAGSRHAKRWQDVEELLDAGISVYTTMNVQHWESLNDVVAQITGVKVRETVPDSFLQKAHEIELVDLPPQDLLKRMTEGKVYAGDQAIRAAENFFQLGNLIALRELAMRHAAERVDAQMQDFKSRYEISRVLPVRERLLVGITAAPQSSRLVRATLRLATSLRCSWITVYVQTPDHEKLPPDQKARIIDTLRLAERLGGETAVVTGQDVAAELLKYARARNVTKIVVGKPHEPRWKEMLFGSTVNEIARRSGEIDLYVISTTELQQEQLPRRSGSEDEKRPAGFWQAALLIVLCTGLASLLQHYLDRTNLVMFYFLAIVWVSYRYGRPVGIFASVLSVMFFDFFVVPPHLSFEVADTEYLITFAVMLVVAIFISTATGRLLAFANATRAREARLRSLYKVSRTLSEIPDPSAMLTTAWQEMEEYFNAPVLLLVADAQGQLRPAAGHASAFGYSGNEVQAAEWVFGHNETAGRGTDTLAGSRGTYLPMRGREKTVGVLAIRMTTEPGLIEPDQLRLLETFAGEIGGALESKELSEAAGRAVASMEAERMKNLVLRSFSFDLSAPSQEIVDMTREIQSARKSEDWLKDNIRKLSEKADKIHRVVARLPKLLQEVFPPATPAPEPAQETPEVGLSDMLSAERVSFFPAGAEKKRILESLVSSLNLPDCREALQAIEEREEAGGILIRPNVAIPHATIAGISGVKAALGIQRAAGSNDGPMFWLLFVSGADSIREHLAFLRSAAITLTDSVLERLEQARTPAEALSALGSANVGAVR